MNEIQKAKATARKTARTIRDALPDRQALSQRIVGSLLQHPALQDASQICCFVSFRSEVSTHDLIRHLLESGRQVCVPWCDGNDLKLYQLESLDELTEGSFGILEPTDSGKACRSRAVPVNNIRTAVVPGLAFTTDGQRLGYGRGYYDRLLARSPATIRVALAFECQIVDQLPVTSSDVRMDWVLTESAVYPPLTADPDGFRKASGNSPLDQG